MGGLTGGAQGSSSNSTSNSSSTSTPWGPQVGDLTGILGAASALYGSQAGNDTYNGQTYAGINPQEEAAAQQEQSFGMGAGNQLANSGASGLSNLFGNAGAYSTNATNMAANGTAAANSGDMSTLNGYGNGSQTANLVNSGLSNALNSAGTSGANSINGFLGSLQNVSNQATQDPTKQIQSDASSYMNSPALQNSINSTNAGIENTLNQQTLTGINSSAAMGGTLNSSRAGAANAEAEGQAALAMGSADASLENNAYNTGISTATNTYENGLNTAASAANSGMNDALGAASTTANLQNNEGQFNTSTALSAANSGIAQQLASEGLNANTELNANSQLGQGIFDASLGTGNVMNAAGTAGELGGAYGSLLQSNQQGQDTASYNQWLGNLQTPWSILGAYSGIANAPNYPSTTSTGTTSGSSLGWNVGASVGGK